MTVLHPTYFPSLQSFARIAQGDVIWETQDNFQKQTFRNRTHIATDRGKHRLSIPIVHVGSPTGRQRYKNVMVDNTYNWQRQHWRTLETAYRTSPFFEFYEDDLKPFFSQRHHGLLDLNLGSIALVCDCLQIPFPQERTTSYEQELPQYTDKREWVNAKGPSSFRAPEYVQVFGDRHGFLSNLSILDALFNLGPDTLAYLGALAKN
ncbi:WbqC family protein [Maribacter sp. 2307ULW6-5]|uniref:WbqC family protein n=1 Tax=Maribacter sp. 2307ULW6-5 TaxID=3386275 RepID=UPI0039BCEB35